MTKKIENPKCLWCETEDVMQGGIDDEGNFYCEKCWEEYEEEHR